MSNRESKRVSKEAEQKLQHYASHARWRIAETQVDMLCCFIPRSLLNQNPCTLWCCHCDVFRHHSDSTAFFRSAVWWLSPPALGSLRIPSVHGPCLCPPQTLDRSLLMIAKLMWALLQNLRFPPFCPAQQCCPVLIFILQWPFRDLTPHRPSSAQPDPAVIILLLATPATGC